MQSLAALTKVYGVAQSQQSILASIDHKALAWRQELAAAQEADRAEFRNLLVNTTSTITRVQREDTQRELTFENLGGEVRELKDLVAQLKLVSFVSLPCFSRSATNSIDDTFIRAAKFIFYQSPA